MVIHTPLYPIHIPLISHLYPITMVIDIPFISHSYPITLVIYILLISHEYGHSHPTFGSSGPEAWPALLGGLLSLPRAPDLAAGGADSGEARRVRYGGVVKGGETWGFSHQNTVK